jgi:predicted transcriptional regulator
MTTLTIRLPEDTTLRLKQLAAARGISLNKLMEELGTTALAVTVTPLWIFWRGWTNATAKSTPADNRLLQRAAGAGRPAR